MLAKEAFVTLLAKMLAFYVFLSHFLVFCIFVLNTAFLYKTITQFKNDNLCIFVFNNQSFAQTKENVAGRASQRPLILETLNKHSNIVIYTALRILVSSSTRKTLLQTPFYHFLTFLTEHKKS